MTEEGVAQAAAIVTAVANGGAAAYAGWFWWRVEPNPSAWTVLRIAQVIAVAQAIVAGVLAASGYDPHDELYWLYAGLPVAINVIAEQLRIAAAEQVLEARGLPDAQSMKELDEIEQRSVVMQIVRREVGVVTVAAGTVAFLALRAAITI